MQSMSLRVEQFLITAGRGQVGVAGDLLGQRVAAVVKVGGADAFHARQSESAAQQAGPLHADTDHAEAHASLAAAALAPQRPGPRRQAELSWRPADCRPPQHCSARTGGGKFCTHNTSPWAEPDWAELTASLRCDYFFNGLIATSLKNTMSLSLWFCSPK